MQSAFVRAFFAYVEARAALLAAESKAVLLKLVSVVAFGLGALVAIVFGYIFVLMSLVGGSRIAPVFPGHGSPLSPGYCTSEWLRSACSWRSRHCAAGFTLKRAQN
jgi:hypothetical protein